MKKLLSIALLALASAAQATIVQVAAPGALGPGPMTLETFEGAPGRPARTTAMRPGRRNGAPVAPRKTAARAHGTAGAQHRGARVPG